MTAATLIINAELLGILVTNLMKNAVKYTTGSVVEVNGMQDNDNYTILIKNKGTIAEEDLERLFAMLGKIAS